MNTDDTLVIPGTGSLTTTPRSKAELAEQMYPGQTYDCALPQWWVDDVQELGFCNHPAGIFVWGLRQGRLDRCTLATHRGSRTGAGQDRPVPLIQH